MPLIGYTVFKEEVRSGKKRQTIRKLRMLKGKPHPIKVGETLYHYWHTRRKDCEKLREDPCTETFLIQFCYDPNFCGGGPALRIDRLGPAPVNEKPWASRQLRPMEVEDLAHRDGFKDELEMAAWFYKTHKNLAHDTFQVIRW